MNSLLEDEPPSTDTLHEEDVEDAVGNDAHSTQRGQQKGVVNATGTTKTAGAGLVGGARLCEAMVEAGTMGFAITPLTSPRAPHTGPTGPPNKNQNDKKNADTRQGEADHTHEQKDRHAIGNTTTSKKRRTSSARSASGECSRDVVALLLRVPGVT